MLPEEREYRVGPSGFQQSLDGADTRYPPGALVWLRTAPAGADLQPTGAVRRYQNKLGVPRVQRKRKRAE